MEMLDRHTLTQATMQRQLLLERPAWSAYAAIEHLVGLQAQEPHEPYVGLWSRLRDFQPAELVDLLEQRRAVRTLMMRRTLHLMTSEDCLALRPLHDAMLITRMRGTLGRALPGVDFDELAAAGEPLFAASPRTLTEVARAIGARWPQAAPRDLGDALSTVLRLVQTPPRGIWGRQAPARNTTIRAWLGRTRRPRRAGRPGAALPAGLRPGHELRCTRLVRVERPPGGDQTTSAAAAILPRRAGSGAAGRARGRAARRSRAFPSGTYPPSTTLCSATTTGPGSSTTSTAG